MFEIFRFLNQILLLIFFISSMKNVDTTVNYKLTSIYYGNQGLSMDEIGNLSSWVGKRQAVVVLFTDWCSGSMNNLFNILLDNIWNNKSVPLITWQITGCDGRKQPGIMGLIHNNSYDTYINQFGDRLKIWLAGSDQIYGNNDDRRAYIRLGMKFEEKSYSCQRSIE
jgi:mannan endo-1,4-beta-mannosidase